MILARAMAQIFHHPKVNIVFKQYADLPFADRAYPLLDVEALLHVPRPRHAGGLDSDADSDAPPVKHRASSEDTGIIEHTRRQRVRAEGRDPDWRASRQRYVKEHPCC